MTRAILGFSLILAPIAIQAQEKQPDKPGAEPAGTPLELSITGKAKYPHDLIGYKTSAEYREAIDAVAKGKKKLPRPPFVDIAVEVKNTSDKAVQVWAAGDPVVLTLNLKGKGAVEFAPPVAFTEEFRAPKAVAIEPGKTHKFAFTSLVSGYRMAAQFSFWTEPGEYELTATLKTAMNPAPKGAKEAMGGFGQVTVRSAPFKLTVEVGKK